MEIETVDIDHESREVAWWVKREVEFKRQLSQLKYIFKIDNIAACWFADDGDLLKRVEW